MKTPEIDELSSSITSLRHLFLSSSRYFFTISIDFKNSQFQISHVRISRNIIMTATSSYSTTWTTTELSSKMLAHLLSEEEYRIYDTLLAATLTLCTLVGLPGNLLSLFYFYSASRRDFSSFIYTIVSAIDTCTCVFHLPVMIALYNTRKPGAFENMTFCLAWIVAFENVQLISMFLVMLLSVSRTITLVFLQYKIKKKILSAAVILYTSFLITWCSARIIGGTGSDEIWQGYWNFDVFCSWNLYKPPWSHIDKFVRAVCIGIPPILTTISFTIVAYKLLQKSKVSSKNERKHQAAVTMAMFTALFLVCNLPCLLNNIMWYVNMILKYDIYSGPIYSFPFMAYYSWVISDVICTVLNAALNPVLYLSRMSQYQAWVSAKRSQRVHNRTSGRKNAHLHNKKR